MSAVSARRALPFALRFALLVATIATGACGGSIQPAQAPAPTPTTAAPAAAPVAAPAGRQTTGTDESRAAAVRADEAARAAAAAAAASAPVDRSAAAAEDARARNAAAAAMARNSAAAEAGSIEQVILFDFDDSEILPTAAALLDAKAAMLQKNSAMRVRIVGNTDERGSDEYNLALGQRRAAAARRYLASRGIAESRMDVISYGEERPVCRLSEESCWAQNRRDEFVIVTGSSRQ